VARLFQMALFPHRWYEIDRETLKSRTEMNKKKKRLFSILLETGRKHRASVTYLVLRINFRWETIPVTLKKSANRHSPFRSFTVSYGLPSKLPLSLSFLLKKRSSTEHSFGTRTTSGNIPL